MENFLGTEQVRHALLDYNRQILELEAATAARAAASTAPSEYPPFNHLYGLGFPFLKDPLQTSIGRSLRIRVLWKSWCDAIYASFDGVRVCVIVYVGIGLTTVQKAHVFRNRELGHAVDGKDGWGVMWFGSTMHEGLRGYVLSKRDADGAVSEQKVVVFATDMEIEDGVSDIHSYGVSGDVRIMDVKILSDGSLMLCTKTCSTNTDSTLNVSGFKQLRQYFSSGSLPEAPVQTPYIPRNPPVCVTNATTTAALDIDGKVWTSTTDPRYPKALGRPYEGSSKYEMVPYLSETTITKLVSGGYMTAAVSADGELFLWGQACPGSTGELKVLSGDVQGAMARAGVSTLGEQDEHVKCLNIFIDGEEACVIDVAIGQGHILIAAEVRKEGGKRSRAVFAAGDNSKDQIGLGMSRESCESFEEVVAWRGKRVVQLAAAGWTSFAVMAEY